MSKCKLLLTLMLFLKFNSYVKAEISDPLEDVNRKIFWFNNKLDVYALEPVAQVYEENLPKNVRKGISNFFNNLQFPIYFVSDILQLKFTQASNDTTRFIVNSTLGFFGFFDLATCWGIESKEEDFTAVLDNYGMGNGIYLVIPFFGPSSARDTVALAFNISLSPIWHIADLNIAPRIANSSMIGLGIVDTIDSRDGSMKLEKSLDLDYYSTVKMQHFKKQKTNKPSGKFKHTQKCNCN